MRFQMNSEVKGGSSQQYVHFVSRISVGSHNIKRAQEFLCCHKNWSFSTHSNLLGIIRKVNKYKHSNDFVVVKLFWSLLKGEFLSTRHSKQRNMSWNSSLLVCLGTTVWDCWTTSCRAAGIPCGDRHEVRLRGSDSRLQTWPPPPSWPWTPTCWTIAMQPTSLLLLLQSDCMLLPLEKQPENIIITSPNGITVMDNRQSPLV